MTISDVKLQLEEDEKSLLSARFVQQGLLPKERHFKRMFKEHFVLYFPQRIISGDFYWVGQKHDLKYLVVGDCTGHGVSASLLSVLALNLFEYVIMNKGIKKTNKILKTLDNKFIESFKDAQKVNFDNPWIDLSLIRIDEKHQKIQYSTANRKLFHVPKKGEAKIHRGSSYPIGGWQIEENRTFDSASFHYEKGDAIYLGSDGFQDQIGGPRDKKFTSKRLHNLLDEIGPLPMHYQQEKLAIEFMKWKGQESQTDDVCVLGVRL